MKTLMQYISDFDTFGQPIKVRFRGKGHYKTTRGGLLTMITYLCVVFLGLELSQRFYKRSEPIVTRYERRHSVIEPINLWQSRQTFIPTIINSTDTSVSELDPRAG